MTRADVPVPENWLLTADEDILRAAYRITENERESPSALAVG